MICYRKKGFWPEYEISVGPNNPLGSARKSPYINLGWLNLLSVRVPSHNDGVERHVSFCKLWYTGNRVLRLNYRKNDACEIVIGIQGSAYLCFAGFIIMKACQLKKRWQLTGQYPTYVIFSLSLSRTRVNLWAFNEADVRYTCKREYLCGTNTHQSLRKYRKSQSMLA